MRRDAGVVPGGERRHAQRQRHLDVVAGSEQHRHRTRRAGSFRAQIDDADPRVIGKLLHLFESEPSTEERVRSTARA